MGYSSDVMQDLILHEWGNAVAVSATIHANDKGCFQANPDFVRALLPLLLSRP
jgi:hypothetical protein